MLTMPKRVLACYPDLTDDCKSQSAAPIMVSYIVICCKVKNAEFRFYLAIILSAGNTKEISKNQKNISAQITRAQDIRA